MPHKILIIDDDVDICQLLKSFLERKGFVATSAFNASDGLSALQKTKFDLVLSDFRLPDKDGFELIKSIKEINPSIPIIVITGYSDVKQAVKAIQLGVFEYVTKPIYPEEILLHINKALAQNKEEIPTATSSKVKKDNTESEDYVFGNSLQSKQVIQQIDLVAPTDMTVVILGESGTGKEVVARMIHQKSNRKNKPFVAVDCGALPQELAGSELFGHVKGAFTGALVDKIGHFESAQGGTLFLDEIGNLSYENQIKLLRVLQERTIRRVGGEKDLTVDVRIIVATNEDLKNAMQKGSFREDIYYRINEFKIELPSLKENVNDIEQFVSFFIEKANQELEKTVEKLDDEVLEIFKLYTWPGNIRELKNVVKRAVLLSPDKVITKNVLPIEIINSKFSQSTDFTDFSGSDLKTIVEKAEMEAIKNALIKTKNNKSKCAKLLGIDRKTLYNKMDAYNLKD